MKSNLKMILNYIITSQEDNCKYMNRLKMSYTSQMNSQQTFENKLSQITSFLDLLIIFIDSYKKTFTKKRCLKISDRSSTYIGYTSTCTHDCIKQYNLLFQYTCYNEDILQGQTTLEISFLYNFRSYMYINKSQVFKFDDMILFTF